MAGSSASVVAAVGQFGGRRFAAPRQPYLLQQALRLRVQSAQHAVGAPEIQRIATRALQGEAHVLARGQMREHRGDLEAAHQPKSCHGVGPQPGDVTSPEPDPARARL
jgi:hypothetical protein